jgi:hypothetical protein
MEMIYAFVTSLAMKDVYLNTTGVYNSPVLFLYVSMSQKTRSVKEGMYLKNT